MIIIFNNFIFKLVTKFLVTSQDHVSSHRLEGEFFGTQDLYDVPKLVQQGNPITYVDDKPLPPFLIMHGNKG
ncbi:hypothetical protein PCE01_16530 [Pediococcus cellicola]|nr:hypothetical protein PCE01_16530 [Pediococcus cellicola]